MQKENLPFGRILISFNLATAIVATATVVAATVTAAAVTVTA